MSWAIQRCTQTELRRYVYIFHMNTLTAGSLACRGPQYAENSGDSVPRRLWVSSTLQPETVRMHSFPARPISYHPLPSRLLEEGCQMRFSCATRAIHRRGYPACVRIHRHGRGRRDRRAIRRLHVYSSDPVHRDRPVAPPSSISRTRC